LVDLGQRALEALREHRRVLRGLLSELSGYAYRCRMNATWTLDFATRGIETVTGYSAEEWTRRRSVQFRDVIHPVDVPRVEAAVRGALRKRKPFEVTYRIRAKSGEERWVVQRGHGVPGKNGETLFVEGWVADVTDRKRAERALRQSEERFRLVARATNDVVRDWDVPSGRVWWNEAFAASFGYRAEPAAPGLESWSERLHPEDRERVVASLHEAIQRRENCWSGEYRFRRADGSYADVLDRGCVLYGEEGQAVRMVGAMQDISERKQHERLLGNLVAVTSSLSGEEFFPALALHLAAAVDCRRLVVAERVPGQPDHWRALADWPSGHRVAGSRCVVAGTPLAAAVERKQPVSGCASNQELFPFTQDTNGANALHFLAEPLLGKGGTVIGLICVVRKGSFPNEPRAISILELFASRAATELERQRAERALALTAKRLQVLSHRLLQAQENERRHIANELHDEVGQSLTALEMNLQTLSAAAPAQDRRLGECLAIAGQVLDRVRSLSLELRPSLLDDLGLVPALQWFIQQQHQRTGLTIDLLAPPALPRLGSAVETSCFRIVQEALTNVLRHARANAAAVEVRHDGHELRLSIRDDGVGFDVAAMRQRAKQGKSLGLLSLEERATVAGGHMELRSAPNQGTEVLAYFPAEPTRPSTADENGAAVAKANGRVRVRAG
jgi:PAS domain S-box-containing protein